MSTEPITSNARTSAFETVGDLSARLWRHIEAGLVRVGDWLNPILVKETRQALKSRQFVITFLLVLGACWVATIIGVAAIGPAIFYAAAGNTLLYCYFTILAFPLAIVVPYSAFRSLASEREDNTYDLLSITTLSPRQIISGKLGSSIAQMAIYFCAVAPCLAFTYLLRGVDVLTIAALLLHSFVCSLGLSMIGLFLATLSKQRYSQIFISVVFVAGLIGAFILGLMLAYEMLSHSYMYVSASDFWAASLAWFTAYGTTFAPLFFASAGMITFNSENRSTPLRIAMFVQQACWVGWMGFIWVMEGANDRDIVEAMVLCAGVYWYFMGILLTSERPQMSERVKRRLPSSFFGRAYLSWLNPGAASGYMFVVANATSLLVMAFLALTATEWLGRSSNPVPSFSQFMSTIFVGWSYLVVYLGVGLLLVTAIRRVASVSMVAAALIQILLLMVGTGIPWTIQMMSVNLRYIGYTLLQITNPIWTMYHLIDSSTPLDTFYISLILLAAAICVLTLNLPNVLRELRNIRIAPPTRVVEDEQILHPQPAPQPTNPWDEQS